MGVRGRPTDRGGGRRLRDESKILEYVLSRKVSDTDDDAGFLVNFADDIIDESDEGLVVGNCYFLSVFVDTKP